MLKTNKQKTFVFDKQRFIIFKINGKNMFYFFSFNFLTDFGLQLYWKRKQKIINSNK